MNCILAKSYLLLPFAGLEDAEHFGVRHWLHLRNRHLPLPSLFFPLLLDRIGQHLRPTHPFSVQQVGRHSAFGDGVVIRMLIGSLAMLGNRLAHDGFLLVALLLIELGPQTMDLLGEVRTLVRHPGLLLALSLIGVKPTAMQLGMPFHVLMLRHSVSGLSRTGAKESNDVEAPSVEPPPSSMAPLVRHDETSDSARLRGCRRSRPYHDRRYSA